MWLTSHTCDQHPWVLALQPAARTWIVLFGTLAAHASWVTNDLGEFKRLAPRLCHVGTARGDQGFFQAWFTEAGRAAGIDVSHLNLFPLPSVDDMTGCCWIRTSSGWAAEAWPTCSRSGGFMA